MPVAACPASNALRANFGTRKNALHTVKPRRAHLVPGAKRLACQSDRPHRRSGCAVRMTTQPEFTPEPDRRIRWQSQARHATAWQTRKSALRRDSGSTAARGNEEAWAAARRRREMSSANGCSTSPLAAAAKSSRSSPSGLADSKPNCVAMAGSLAQASSVASGFAR